MNLLLVECRPTVDVGRFSFPSGSSTWALWKVKDNEEVRRFDTRVWAECWAEQHGHTIVGEQLTFYMGGESEKT